MADLFACQMKLLALLRRAALRPLTGRAKEHVNAAHLSGKPTPGDQNRGVAPAWLRQYNARAIVGHRYRVIAALR